MNIHAKDLSLISKSIALVFVVGMYVGALLVSKRLPSGEEAFGIIQIGCFIALSFAPVDISMVIKNLRKPHEE
jgi:hypothetical protein